jgi:hypothetical protein
LRLLNQTASYESDCRIDALLFSFSFDSVTDYRSTDAAPQILHTFNEQTLVPGPLVTLKCAAIGNPTPDITWTLDRYPMPITDRLASLLPYWQDK